MIPHDMSAWYKFTKKGSLILLFFSTTIFLGILFYKELYSLPTAYRILATSGATSVFVVASYLIFSITNRLTKKQVIFLLFSAGIGIFLCSKVPNVRQSENIIAIGKMLLSGWAFFNIGLFLMSSFKNIPISQYFASVSRSLRKAWPIVLFLLFILCLACWSQSKSSFIYYWDYRTYWSKVEHFYDPLHLGNWKEVVRGVAKTYSDNYGPLAALPPTLFSLFSGYPTALRYLITIIILYAWPAYIIVAYLGRRLCSERDQFLDRPYTWALTSIPIMLGFPIYFCVVLYLMLDIGGVILFVAALLFTDKLIQLITSKYSSNILSVSHEFMKLSLGLGLLLSLMFLFRRWYIFASAGIVLSGGIILFSQLWNHKQDWRKILQRTIVAIILISFAAIPLLAPVLFDWSRDIEQHNYAKLYTSCKRTFVNDVFHFIKNFGVVLPLLSMISIVVLYRFNQARQLLFLLIASSIFAALLFLQVQSPSQHHLYLLMPLLVAPIASLCIILFRRYGWAAPCGLMLIVLLGELASTIISPQVLLKTCFVGYHDWLPKQQQHAKPLRDIGEWLNSPEMRDKKFIFFRSPSICGGQIQELWQLIPTLSHADLRDRFIPLNTLGTQDDGARKNINQCDIALMSTQLKQNDPISGKVFQHDLMTNTGIGVAFAKTSVAFPIDENTTFLVYQRTRDISRREYLEYVQRCIEYKINNAMSQGY